MVLSQATEAAMSDQGAAVAGSLSDLSLSLQKLKENCQKLHAQNAGKAGK